LRVDKDKWEILAENIPIGVILLDSEEKLEYINNSAEVILGLKDVEIGKKLFEIVPDYEIDELVKKTLKSKENNSISIYYWSNEKKLLEIRSIYLEDGKVFLIIEDKSIYEKLEENYRDFIANASHELRTPLTSIQILLDLFSEKKITLEEIQNEFFPYLKKEIMRMTKLVTNLLNLSRLESGVVQINPQKIFLIDIIDKVLESLYPLIKKKGLKLHLDVPSSLEIYADPQHLETILFNLLENAVKYTPENKQIFIYSNFDDNNIVLVIKDTGVGIPEKDLPYIFDRFYRVERSRTSEDGFSSGLGLAIVKKLVEKHNWKIEVESELNLGTTFKILIPKGKEG